MIDLDKLSAPFSADKIHWRIGATNKDKTKGLALAYLDARDVMARLDEVCGVGHWQNRYPHVGNKTCCEIGVYSEELKAMVWKSNGAGDTDVEGEKGAFSDAFKRTAVLWGIGRYLYDLDNVWVELEARGKSYIIKDGQQNKLNAALNKVTGKKPAPQKPPSPEDEPDPFEENEEKLTAQFNEAKEAIKAATNETDLKAAYNSKAKPVFEMLSGPEQEQIKDAVSETRAKWEQAA